jgi:hypothetical protein
MIFFNHYIGTSTVKDNEWSPTWVTQRYVGWQDVSQFHPHEKPKKSYTKFITSRINDRKRRR